MSNVIDAWRERMEAFDRYMAEMRGDGDAHGHGHGHGTRTRAWHQLPGNLLIPTDRSIPSAPMIKW